MYDIWKISDFLFFLKNLCQFCKMIQDWKTCNIEKYKKYKNHLISQGGNLKLLLKIYGSLGAVLSGLLEMLPPGLEVLKIPTE